MPETTPMPNETAKILAQSRAMSHVERLAGHEPERLEHREPGGQPDGESREDDVEADGEGELDARQQKRVELGHV